MSATGGCLCGAVRFEADSVGADVHACHCSMCLAWSGGPAIVAFVDGITFEGGDITVYDSSSWAQRAFCPRCGSNLYYKLKGHDRYYVAMGAFDDLSKFELADEIWIDAKPSAYAFIGDHPRLTKQEFLDSLQQDDT